MTKEKDTIFIYEIVKEALLFLQGDFYYIVSGEFEA